MILYYFDWELIYKRIMTFKAVKQYKLHNPRPAFNLWFKRHFGYHIGRLCLKICDNFLSCNLRIFSLEGALEIMWFSRDSEPENKRIEIGAETRIFSSCCLFWFLPSTLDLPPILDCYVLAIEICWSGQKVVHHCSYLVPLNPSMQSIKRKHFLPRVIWLVLW